MPRENQGPKLRRNTFGKYEIRWTEKGRSKSRSTGTTDHGIAQKIYANFLLLKDRADIIAEAEPDGPLLVCQIIGDVDKEGDELEGADYWHEHVLREVIGVENQRLFAVKILKHFGHLAVRDIRPSDTDAYVDARRTGTLGRPSKDGTIARELSVLSAAVNHAVRAKRISHDDAPTIELPDPSPPKDRWLTHAEAARLLDAALEGRPSKKDGMPRAYKFIAIALATASRKTAILELKREQIDMERGMIMLNPAGRRQTKKRRPPVPMSDELKPILKEILESTNGDYVLEHPGSIRSAFNSAVRRAGLAGVTPHTLRHTWATWAAQAGVSLMEIAAVLGDTYATVERNYLHHCPEHLRGAVNAVSMRKTG